MKRELTYADQAKRIYKKYEGRTDKLSIDSMHRELAALEQQQEAIRAQMNLIEPQQMAAWGGPGGYVNQPDNNLLAMGGMIKRADGSYSKRGLWDNIRANKGSGKKPTKQMLEQEKKIKAEYAMGGMMYASGGKLPKEILLPRLESHMSSEEANDYINQYGNGGYTVTKSNDRKGKTHKVTGPDGTVKYFGDSNLGQHPNDPERKKAFYARHADNIKNNPYFKAYADATWAYGGGIDNPGFRALPIEVQNNIKNNMAMGGKYVTAGNEYHKVYRNADGDIIVNHPKEDKGKWDTINLTEKSNANTIAEGVKSVKDWHKNNPYAYGGMIYAMGGENNTWKEGPVSQRDSVANMARNTMIWEANRGSGAGTGLSNFGNSALSPGASIDESVDWYMQNIYPKLEAYPTAMEKASAGDFLYNTGKNLLNYTDWDNRKNDTAALASWEEKLKTLTPNERRIALNNARDRYYKNTAPAGSTWDLKTQGPHPAYWNTWYGRQHATDQYTPLTDQDVTNRANKKFYPVQKAMGGEIESAIAPAFFSHGGGIHIDPSKKGTFTAAATKHGKSVQGFASQVLANKENYSPAMVKKANFAKNASKWKHAYGGPMGMYFDGTGKGYNGVIPSEETINKWNLMYPEDGLKYLTPQPTPETPEFEMPYDQMVKTFSSPYSRDYNGPFVEQPVSKIPITKTNDIKIPQSKEYTEFINPSKLQEKPNIQVNYDFKKRKEPFNYLGLTQLAGPLMDLYYGIKGPDQVNFDRVRAEQINLAPQTQADLVRRGSSLPMYLAKQQGLGQGNYLNTLAAISGKAGENIGKSYLESKLAQEQFNAQAKTGANATNAQIAMQESIARQQERDAARSAVTKGAGELGKGIATLSIDPRLAASQANQNKILIELLKQTNPSMNLNSLNKK